MFCNIFAAFFLKNILLLQRNFLPLYPATTKIRSSWTSTHHQPHAWVLLAFYIWTANLSCYNRHASLPCNIFLLQRRIAVTILHCHPILLQHCNTNKEKSCRRAQKWSCSTAKEKSRSAVMMQINEGVQLHRRSRKTSYCCNLATSHNDRRTK